MHDLKHWDSMMVFEDTTKSLFPSDLFIQPGTNKPVVSEDLSEARLLHTDRQESILIALYFRHMLTLLKTEFVSTKTRNGCCLLGE